MDQIFVGPMVGLTHVAFRELVRSYLPTRSSVNLYSEMLSSRRLPTANLKTNSFAKFSDADRGIHCQLLGNESRFIRPSIEKLEPLAPSSIDINMGCPVKQTLRHNWGVRLMGDADYAARVVEMCVAASPYPVTVKLRADAPEGSSTLSFLDTFTNRLESAGAARLTIHGRPRSSKHRGPADWSTIEEIAKRRNIPVVANGNIQTVEDVLKLLSGPSGGAMIGRAAVARPWILWQIEAILSPGTLPPPPVTPLEEGEAFLIAAEKLFELLVEFFSEERDVLKKFRFYMLTAHPWFNFGHNLWAMSMKAKTKEELAAGIKEFQDRYSGSFTMAPRARL